MLPDLTLDEPRMIALAGTTALVAGAVRGFGGFGGPALMALVLTQFYNPLSVLTKVIIIDAISYLVLVPNTAREFNRRVILIVTAAALTGLPAGVYLLTVMDPVVMKRAVAGAVAACAAVMLLGGRFRTSPSIMIYVAVGLLAGVVLGATYIALVAMIFFFSLPVSGAESRANAVFWGVVLAYLLIGVHITIGYITIGDLWRSALVGIPYLAGTAAGTWWFRRIGERGFRRAVLGLLLALAAVGLVT